MEGQPVLVAHAAMTAKRLGLHAPPRSPRIFDALELWAFVRPAQFCAPSAAGLALALGMAEPRGASEQAGALREVCGRLLHELAMTPWPSREEALAIAETLARGGWAWGPATIGALRSAPVGNAFRGSGLDVWTRTGEWEDQAPLGESGTKPIDPHAAAGRLAELLGKAGLTEARPTQALYATEAAFAFQPREREGEPRMMLAEAGTGVGKTLGYLAPASLWAEANGPAVWVSTYTRALQRQIERESRALWPDPEVRARKAVVRKGRENYLCLLNMQEMVNTAMLGRATWSAWPWPRAGPAATRDGDMTGGDFPAWLPTLFAVAPANQGSAANLVDRRGECVHAGCVPLPQPASSKRRCAPRAGRHCHRQPRPGPDPGRLRRGPSRARPEDRRRDHDAQAHRLRRGPPPVRRRRQRLRGRPLRRRGGRDAPLDPRAGRPRASRPGPGNPADRKMIGDREDAKRAARRGDPRRLRPAGRGLERPDRPAQQPGESPSGRSSTSWWR
jgi:hypothetical protein